VTINSWEKLESTTKYTLIRKKKKKMRNQVCVGFFCLHLWSLDSMSGPAYMCVCHRRAWRKEAIYLIFFFCHSNLNSLLLIKQNLNSSKATSNDFVHLACQQKSKLCVSSLLTILYSALKYHIINKWLGLKTR